MKSSIEMHAIAYDWKQCPINAWSIKSVYNGKEYASARLTDNGIDLLIAGECIKTFCGLNQAVRAAECFFGDGQTLQ